MARTAVGLTSGPEVIRPEFSFVSQGIKLWGAQLQPSQRNEQWRIVSPLRHAATLPVLTGFAVAATGTPDFAKSESHCCLLMVS